MAADADKAPDAPGGERLDGAARAEVARGNLRRGEGVGSGDGLHDHVLAGVRGAGRGGGGPAQSPKQSTWKSWPREWRAVSAPIGESNAAFFY